MESEKHHNIRKILESYVQKILSPISTTNPIKFICKCGIIRNIPFDKFFINVCDKCKTPETTFFSGFGDTKIEIDDIIKICNKNTKNKYTSDEEKAEDKTVNTINNTFVKIPDSYVQVEDEKDTELFEKTVLQIKKLKKLDKYEEEEKKEKIDTKKITKQVDTQKTQNSTLESKNMYNKEDKITNFVDEETKEENNEINIENMFTYLEKDKINTIKLEVKIRNNDNTDIQQVDVNNIPEIKNTNPTVKNAVNKLLRKGCIINTPITASLSSGDRLNYICICEIPKDQVIKDMVRYKDCRDCNTLLYDFEKRISIERYIQILDLLETGKELTEQKDIEDAKIAKQIYKQDIIDVETGEKWRRIPGGWVSSMGKVKNFHNKLIKMSEQNRYKINQKNWYITKLMVIVFRISEYKKILLSKNNFCASRINPNLTDFNEINNINNLQIITKKEIGEKNGKKSKQSENFVEKKNMDLKYYLANFRYVTLNFLPNHMIFENGEIYSIKGKRFLTGSKTPENRLNVPLDGKVYYIHRLICFAFNPLSEYVNYDDYNDLQVNHINGITLDNTASNLEWVTQSQNMRHAYNTGLNKKRRVVLQYSKETDEYINEYPSIAEAVRQTGDKEHQIRASADGDGKNVSTAKYLWRFKFPEESAEYSQKYSSKPKKK